MEEIPGWKSGLLTGDRMDRDNSLAYDSQSTVWLYSGDDARGYILAHTAASLTHVSTTENISR